MRRRLLKQKKPGLPMQPKKPQSTLQVTDDYEMKSPPPAPAALQVPLPRFFVDPEGRYAMPDPKLHIWRGRVAQIWGRFWLTGTGGNGMGGLASCDLDIDQIFVHRVFTEYQKKERIPDELALALQPMAAMAFVDIHICRLLAWCTDLPEARQKKLDDGFIRPLAEEYATISPKYSRGDQDRRRTLFYDFARLLLTCAQLLGISITTRKYLPFPLEEAKRLLTKYPGLQYSMAGMMLESRSVWPLLYHYCFYWGVTQHRGDRPQSLGVHIDRVNSLHIIEKLTKACRLPLTVPVPIVLQELPLAVATEAILAMQSARIDAMFLMEWDMKAFNTDGAARLGRTDDPSEIWTVFPALDDTTQKEIQRLVASETVGNIRGFYTDWKEPTYVLELELLDKRFNHPIEWPPTLDLMRSWWGMWHDSGATYFSINEGTYQHVKPRVLDRCKQAIEEADAARVLWRYTKQFMREYYSGQRNLKYPEMFPWMTHQIALYLELNPEYAEGDEDDAVPAVPKEAGDQSDAEMRTVD
jgi:hypothetical protein